MNTTHSDIKKYIYVRMYIGTSIRDKLTQTNLFLVVVVVVHLISDNFTISEAIYQLPLGYHGIASPFYTNMFTFFFIKLFILYYVQIFP
jgi:hypothetical protein